MTAEIAQALLQQQHEIQRLSQEAGQLFQAEVTKAIVQGVTDAFRTLADRLPQLLGETSRQHFPPPSDDPPILSILSSWPPPSEPPESSECPCPPNAEVQPAAETIEHRAAVAEQTVVDRAVPDLPEPVSSELSERQRLQTARVHYRHGREAGRTGDLEGAIAQFTEVIRLVPNVAVAYVMRGRLLHRLGRAEDTLEDANQALRLDPRLAPAYYLRAAACTRRGENQQAIADLTRFLELEPDHALAFHARGLAHANEGEYDRAISDYGRALRLRPNFLLARYHRAISLRLKGVHIFAVVELTKIIRLRPDYALAYFERALARFSLQEYDQAIEDFEKTIELDPANEEARARREQAAQARKQPGKSIPVAEAERKQLSPRSHDAAKQSTLESCRAENTTPTFLALSCPACGAPGRISWKRLDRLFRCRRCAHWFRVNREGNLTRIDPNPVMSRRARLLKRSVMSVAAIALVLALALGLYSHFRQHSAPPQLPNDLSSRSELWGKAWLSDDRSLLRRLTSSTHDRQLHPWLIRHPPPAAKDRDASSEQKVPQPEIDVRVQKTRPREAVVIVRVTDASRKSSWEFQLDWLERGDVWYFVPTLKR